MMKKVNALVESLGFMATLTFIGGYMDAYTYVTRGGVFANNQTANIAKFGMEICNANWPGVLSSLYPMLATIAGAFFAEHVQTRKFSGKAYKWQQVILLLELIALLLTGFVPVTVPHVAVNLPLSFIAAWQLSSFRKFEGWVHNTTISTGNLRSVGQYWYQALFVEKNPAFTAKTVRYVLLVLSFAFGALLGAVFCNLVGVKAIWLCCVLLMGLLFCHASAVRRQETAR